MGLFKESALDEYDKAVDDYFGGLEKDAERRQQRNAGKSWDELTVDEQIDSHLEGFRKLRNQRLKLKLKAEARQIYSRKK